jgi:hypothetical protein
MPGHFTTLWKLGVLVLRQDSWFERLLGISTKLGRKVLKTLVQFSVFTVNLNTFQNTFKGHKTLEHAQSPTLTP